MAKGSSKIGGGGGSGAGAKISGDVTFEQMMKASDNHVNFEKVVYVSSKNYMPESGPKKDLGKMLEEHHIKDLIVDVYRTNTGTKDIGRLQDLGFEIKAQYIAPTPVSSSIPPKDWYYMVKR